MARLLQSVCRLIEEKRIRKVRNEMKYKVLVADDEPIMRKAMQSLIDWEAQGCRLVCVAENGQEVMAYLKEDIPDILILDVKMPGISGIELARYIYEEKITTKVILLSGYAEFSYAQSAIKYDVKDYVIKSGEFDELLLAIEKAKAEISLEQKEGEQKHQEIKKENFIKSILDGSLYDPEEIRRQAKESGIQGGKSWLVVNLQFYSKEERQRSYVFKSLLRFLKMVFEEKMAYGMAVNRNEMMILLSEDREILLNTIPESCKQIVEMMEKFMRMEVFLGVSHCSNRWEEFADLFDQAECAVREATFYQTKKVRFYRDVEKKKKELYADIHEDLREMYAMTKKGMKSESLERLNCILSILKEEEYLVEDVLDLGIEIKTICDGILAKYNESLNELITTEKTLSQKIQRCHQFRVYREVMLEIIDATVSHINVITNKKDVLLYETERYIQEHYKKNITVSDVARSVGVSLSYLSRIYKEETGMTLIHCINAKKIEAAKNYLRNADMKIYEIAEALGFENTTYFSYFFKKSTGMSPKEYQKNKKK